MSDLDDQVGRTLRRHAEELSPVPLGLDDVRGRASSIRRRRRLASGLGVAAAVAVIVPTAMLATRGTDGDGPTPASQAPPTAGDTADVTPSPSVTATMGADPHALDVRGLPTGAPPAVGVLRASDISPLPYAYARTAEAVVYAAADGVRVQAAGRTFGPYASSSGLARNAAGTTVAWATDDGVVMTWQDGQGQPSTLGTTDLRGAEVAAVTGDGCVVAEADRGCSVYVRGTDQSGRQRSVVLGAGGTGEVDPVRQVLGVRDADEDHRVLGITDLPDDMSSCSAVVDGPTTLMETCDYTLDAFSPDGSYVLASDSYHDGVSSGVIAVLATGGDRLAYRMRSTQTMAGYRQAVWEDDTHVLFTAYQGGKWSIVRMDVHGAMEYAVPPVSGDVLDAPFVLETR